LRHRDEGDGVLVEQFDQLGEVGKRPGEAIHFVDNHTVDPAGSDICQQRLQGRAV
jgi:hypothetical protein